MTTEEQEILDYVNSCIRAEHGKRLQLDDLYTASGLDSFGLFVSLYDIEDKYGIFSKVPEGVDPFNCIDWNSLTVRNIVVDKAVPCL